MINTRWPKSEDVQHVRVRVRVRVSSIRQNRTMINTRWPRSSVRVSSLVFVERKVGGSKLSVLETWKLLRKGRRWSVTGLGLGLEGSS